MHIEQQTKAKCHISITTYQTGNKKRVEASRSRERHVYHTYSLLQRLKRQRNSRSMSVSLSVNFITKAIIGVLDYFVFTVDNDEH